MRQQSESRSQKNYDGIPIESGLRGDSLVDSCQSSGLRAGQMVGGWRTAILRTGPSFQHAVLMKDTHSVPHVRCKLWEDTKGCTRQLPEASQEPWRPTRSSWPCGCKSWSSQICHGTATASYASSRPHSRRRTDTSTYSHKPQSEHIRT